MASILDKLQKDAHKASAIGIGQCHKQTQANFKHLTEMGYKFTSVGLKYPVMQGTIGHHGSRGTKEVLRHTLLFFGTGPNGEAVAYVRYETPTPAAGQSILYIGGVPHKLTDILREVGS